MCIRDSCDLVELRGAKALMTYGSDFYKGYPALTVNSYGKGQAWYVAADAEKEFQEDLIRKIAEQSGISCGVDGEIPKDLEVTSRETEKEQFYIYQNWGDEEVSLPLPKGKVEAVYGEFEKKLSPYGLVIVKTEK